MWQKQLGELYSESWGPSSPNTPPNIKGVKPAIETNDSLRMKGLFGAGDSPANMASLSQSSGQNPMEQEEEPTSIMARFEQWWKQQQEQ